MNIVTRLEDAVSRVDAVRSLEPIVGPGNRLDLGGEPEQLAPRGDDDAPDLGARRRDDGGRPLLGRGEHLSAQARELQRLENATPPGVFDSRR